MPSRTSPTYLLAASAALAGILALSAGGCSNIGGPRDDRFCERRGHGLAQPGGNPDARWKRLVPAIART